VIAIILQCVFVWLLCWSPYDEDHTEFFFIDCLQVRYHLDEDPKTLKVFPIPLHDSNGATLHYDRLSLSPDGRILAATHGSMLQWLCVETGKVLDTADSAHNGMVLVPFMYFNMFLRGVVGNVKIILLS